MADTKDGGPAFPTFEEIEHWDRDSEKYRDSIAPMGGMSLRDYFAAKAMNGLLAQETQEWRDDNASIAERAYGVADALLKAREVERE